MDWKVENVISGMKTKLAHIIFFQRFGWWERRGIHVRPVQPWSPIINTQDLDEGLWEEPDELAGIDVNEKGQLELLARFEKEYSDEYTKLPLSRGEASDGQYHIQNGAFETVDGEILYCMVRNFEPDRIVQIGGGHSTRLILRAIEDSGVDCSLKVFKPYRDEGMREDLSGECTITGEWADDIDVSQFEKSESGDIVFVDSSHVVRTDNDVYRILFQILPTLSDGVLVHFHDIFLPEEYPKDWILDENFQLNEQYAVRALLMWNHRYDVRWMGAYMHNHYPAELASAFDSYEPASIRPAGEMSIPNSLWLEVTD